MKTKLHATVIGIFIFSVSYSQTSTGGNATNPNLPPNDTNGVEDKIDIGLSPRLNFNLTDDAGFSDVTPSIFFGFNHQINSDSKIKDGKTEDRNWKVFLEAGPYTASSPQVSDSNHISNALISPGSFGLTMMFSFNRKCGENIIWNSKIGFQAKTMTPFGDSIGNIMQHTISIGTGITFKELMGIHATYTYGAHNTTTISERNFEKAFGMNVTDLEYLTISGLFCLNKKNLNTDNRMYLLANWYYFPLGNHIDLGIRKFFSLGFVSNLGILSGENNSGKPNENDFGNKGTNVIF